MVRVRLPRGCEVGVRTTDQILELSRVCWESLMKCEIVSGGISAVQKVRIFSAILMGFYEGFLEIWSSCVQL